MSEKFELLDINQAAKFLNVSETSLRRWTNSGRLTCLRIGKKGMRRFRREDLLSFMNEETLEYQYNQLSDVLTGPCAHADGTHICSMYTNDQSKMKFAYEFIDEGLKDNCVCLLIGHRDTIEEATTHLTSGNAQYREEIDGGRLQIFEYLDTGSSQIKMLEAAFATSIKNGAEKFRVVGNVSEGKIAHQNSFEHVLEYERAYHSSIAKKFPVSTLCQYDARRYSGAEVASIYRCHSDNFRYPVDRIID